MRAKDRSEDGFAILSAIVALAIILLLVSSMIVLSGAVASRASLDLRRSQAASFADAIVAETALDLQDARQSMRLRVDGVPSNIQVLGTSMTIKVEDEFGKVDLNAAPSEILSKLIQSAGVAVTDADTLAAGIKSWMRPSSLDNSGVIENGLRSGTRTFRCVSEVLLVPGMTAALLEATEPALTVYSGSGQIDRAVAPYAALLAVNGMAAEDARAIIDERLSGQTADSPLASVKDGRITQAINQFGWPFRVRSTFVFAGLSYRLDATIRLTGAKAPGYVVAEMHFGGGW